jgi:hypothetical protein
MPPLRIGRDTITAALILVGPLLSACAPQALTQGTTLAAGQRASLPTAGAPTLPTAALLPTPSPAPTPSPVATCPPPVVPPADAGPLTYLARSNRCPGLIMAAWGADGAQKGWVAYDPTAIDRATYEALPDALPPGAVPSVGVVTGGMV